MSANNKKLQTPAFILSLGFKRQISNFQNLFLALKSPKQPKIYLETRKNNHIKTLLVEIRKKIL